MSDAPEYQAAMTAIRNGGIPPIQMTRKMLCHANRDGWTIAHANAQYGHLRDIPTNLLTGKLLLVADKDGWTVAHTAAMFGHLDQVPADLVTADLLRLVNRKGHTVAQVATRHKGQLRILLQRVSVQNLKDIAMVLSEELDEACLTQPRRGI